MKSLDLSLNLFTSTKGHFGNKSVYKTALLHLFSKINCFKNKTVHIKISEGEQDVFYAMKDYLHGTYGFNVISTDGNWSHDNVSHAHGYTQDILKMFSDKEVHKCQYSLWMEDDWIFDIADGYKLLDFFELACNILENNKDVLCLRFNNSNYTPNQVIDCKTHLLQGPNYTQYGPCFTFQPNITRTRDTYQAYRIITNNLDKIGHLHIELQSGIGFRPLSESSTPFGLFDYNKVRSIHIGTKEFAEKNIIDYAK